MYICSHTVTPVLIFAKGNRNETSKFSQLMNHVQLGEKLQNIMAEHDQ